mmetsp:Transcript_88383/g.249009  ORF Transcript_88383/g.249009 Transcript_88383/m.249009 type:complete len:219 (-) Transcript_88383:7-663(-)
MAIGCMSRPVGSSGGSPLRAVPPITPSRGARRSRTPRSRARHTHGSEPPPSWPAPRRKGRAPPQNAGKKPCHGPSTRGATTHARAWRGQNCMGKSSCCSGHEASHKGCCPRPCNPHRCPPGPARALQKTATRIYVQRARRREGLCGASFLPRCPTASPCCESVHPATACRGTSCKAEAPATATRCQLRQHLEDKAMATIGPPTPIAAASAATTMAGVA